jgi:methionyl-tRNA synthetase
MTRESPKFLDGFLTMPKHLQESSSARCYCLYKHIVAVREVIVQKCKTCVKHNCVCKVHVWSGKCSKCVKQAQRCNVRVTQSEFTRLAAQKEKLRASIKESREAQDTAMKAHEKALEDLQVACA